MVVPLAVVIIGSFIFLWLWQLLDLMRRGDDEFPGRFDKPLWVAILIFLPILGVVVYGLWKSSTHSVRTKLQRELQAARGARRMDAGAAEPA